MTKGSMTSGTHWVESPGGLYIKYVAKLSSSTKAEMPGASLL